jgi:ADP-ribose pyrophosphatase
MPMTSPSRIVYRASRFHVEKVEQRLEDGSTLVKQIVRHPGAVVVLPIVSDESICMIETFRPAIQKWLWELPAGTMEPPEPADSLARRELEEETGYRCQKITHVHSFAMSPGILDERMHFFVATELSEGPARREPGEWISNRLVTWKQVDQMLRDGKIIDAKTLVALLWYLRYRTHA